MATMTIEAELLDLEKRYWQAIKDQDVDAALRLTDEPCIVTGAQGIGLIDRKTLAAMMKATNYTLNRFELKEGAQVRLLRDDVAIVAYQVHEELTVDGEPVTLDAADSSTWVRRNGGWLCALHTEAIAGDPFGRDRQPSSKIQA
jgi:ketosteroid isomerase-like protein